MKKTQIQNSVKQVIDNGLIADYVPENHIEVEVNEIPSIEKSAEQAASEASLLNEAATDQQQTTEAAGNGMPTASESLAGLLKIGQIGLFFGGLKHTAAVWNDAACEGVANAVVPVLNKYAWGQKVLNLLLTGGGVEEIALVACLAPLTFATVNAYKVDTAKPVQEEATNDASD